MSAIEIMRSIGRPIAYHPALARHVGGVNAAIFLCQLIYWDEKAESEELGVYKTADEWETETGLSYREQAGARKKLRDLGLLTETNQRLQHRIYYKLDRAAFDALIRSVSRREGEIRETTKAQFPNDESAIGEQPKAQSGNNPKRSSLISTEITTETTTENISPPEPADVGFSRFWATYPNTARRTAKAKCLATWQRKGLESLADEIIEHVRAMKRTKQWMDGYEPSTLTYLNQQRWEDGVPASTAQPVANRHGNFAQQRAQAAIDDFVNGPSSRDDNVIDVEVRHVGF